MHFQYSNVIQYSWLSCNIWLGNWELQYPEVVDLGVEVLVELPSLLV